MLRFSRGARIRTRLRPPAEMGEKERKKRDARVLRNDALPLAEASFYFVSRAKKREMCLNARPRPR